MKENRHRPIAGRLVIATGNPGKLGEMRQLLSPYGVEAVSASELGLGEPEETGTTFCENARIKARAAALASALPVASATVPCSVQSFSQRFSRMGELTVEVRLNL